MLFQRKFKVDSFYPFSFIFLEKRKRERSQADLELPVLLRMALSAEIIGMHHHSQLATPGVGGTKKQTPDFIRDGQALYQLDYIPGLP